MQTTYKKASNIIYLTELRRRARRERQAWCLEIGSSVAVILMTAVFTLRMLI